MLLLADPITPQFLASLPSGMKHIELIEVKTEQKMPLLRHDDIFRVIQKCSSTLEFLRIDVFATAFPPLRDFGSFAILLTKEGNKNGAVAPFLKTLILQTSYRPTLVDLVELYHALPSLEYFGNHALRDDYSGEVDDDETALKSEIEPESIDIMNEWWGDKCRLFLRHGTGRQLPLNVTSSRFEDFANVDWLVPGSVLDIPTFLAKFPMNLEKKLSSSSSLNVPSDVSRKVTKPENEEEELQLKWKAFTAIKRRLTPSFCFGSYHEKDCGRHSSGR
jgi:hypothetical protein